jgi:hypothetical protein
VTQAQVTSDSVLSKYMLGPMDRPGGGWTMGGGTQAANMRTWSTMGTGGTAKVIAQDAIALAARGGPMTVQAIQSVGLGAAARAVAGGMVTGGPLWAAGSAAYLLFDLYRVHEASQYPGTQCASTLGLLCFDPGASQVTETIPCLRADQMVVWSGQPCHNSIQQAGDAYAAYLNESNYEDFNPPRPYRTSVWSVSTYPATVGEYGSMRGDYTYYNGNGTTTYGTSYGSYRVFQSGTQTITSCPASTDPANPAYSVPAGEAPGPDGKCRTARYNHAPVTVEQAAQKVEAYPPASPSTWQQALQDAVASGQQVPAKLETQGPATQTGTPTTTTETTSTGTTTKTTVPTYAYNYAGDTITYSTTTNTYTCTGAGACSSSNATSTTTTTTDPAPAKPQDPEDPCTDNPGRVGCKALGGTKEAPPLQTTPITLNITPASGFGPSSAACPAPRTASVAGLTLAMPFDLLCEFADGIRPIVIGLAWVSAILGFMGLSKRD